uniref:Uncharacterized protein n=1 Tax=Caenorhabditis japonica TaxID=281687 RepID=A0A8R1DJ01_CAEJA
MLPSSDKLNSSFRGKPYTENYQRPSAFRRIKSKIRPNPTKEEDSFWQRRQKPFVPAGMFAQAKRSSNYNYSASSTSNCDDEDVEHELPQKMAEFPARNVKFMGGWDFSDIYDSKQKPLIPDLKTLNSEEEKEDSKMVLKEPEKSQKKEYPNWPWLRDINSDEFANKTPKKAEKLVENPHFESSILRYSARLDKTLENFPKLPLQNNTDTMLGTLEKAVVTLALSQKDADPRPQSVPVYDMLLERSDWLMYREEINDEEDYLPTDPFFSTDVISSDFEEYEQELESNTIPTYLKSEITPSAQSSRQDFLQDKNTLCQMESQEDFFAGSSAGANETNKTLKLKRKVLDKDDKFIGKAPSPARKISKLMDFNEDWKDFPSETAPCTSSDYSPFDYSLFSQSTAPSTSSAAPSKYSFF